MGERERCVKDDSEVFGSRPEGLEAWGCPFTEMGRLRGVGLGRRESKIHFGHTESETAPRYPQGGEEETPEWGAGDKSTLCRGGCAATRRITRGVHVDGEAWIPRVLAFRGWRGARNPGNGRPTGQWGAGVSQKPREESDSRRGEWSP